MQLSSIEVATLRVRNPAFTFDYDIVPAAIVADRQLNLPLLTATDTLVVLALAQTFLTGVKTFNSSILAIRNPADTFSYTVVAAAITAARNLTLPLITADDTLAVLGLAQTWTALQSFGTNLGGTLQTAAQPNVTSLGTLTGLTMGGNLAMAGNSITSSAAFTISTSVGAITFTPTTDVLFSNNTGVVIGHTAQITGYGVLAEAQILGTGGADSALIIGNWSQFSNPALILLKSRNTTIGSFTAGTLDSSVGEIVWVVDDGNDYASSVASIAVGLLETAAADDTPGYMQFSTTANGASSPTERVRIDSVGNIIMGILTPGTSGTRTLLLTNSGVAPSAAATDGVHLFAQDIAAATVLGIFAETAVVATADVPVTTKIIIRYNGVSYALLASTTLT